MAEMTAEAQKTTKRKAKSNIRVKDYAYPILAIAVGIGFWELFVRVAGIKTYILPAPSLVILELIDQASNIFNHSLVTGWEIILGFLLSVIVGIPLGMAIYYSRFLERIFYPVLVASQTIPKIAIAPLLVIWFGFGLMPKVIVSFLIAFFPIVINTVVGLKQTQPEMIYLVRSMGASRIQTFLKISLPTALPNIFGGLKVAITLAVVGAVVGEFIAADKGLGYLLVVANGYLDTPLMFAGIIALSALGIIFFFIVEVLERVFVPWRIADQEEMSKWTM
ncbi:MAG: Riboflavin transport system permease protein RibX [Anaerolineae bacterium]|mgnify:CR=1 FL=1|nr:Riboflavin transport system permease protein RibX [Anaerolineae bacterium]